MAVYLQFLTPWAGGFSIVFLYDYVLPGPHLFANAGYRYDPFLPPADSLMLDRFVAGPFF